MMLPKFSIVPALLVVVLASHGASAHPSVSPNSIAYHILAEGSDAPHTSLLDELAKDGVVSITGIPNFNEVKRSLMSHLHACIMSINAGDKDVVPTEYYQDGTVRRSFAASTLPNGGAAQPIKSLEEFTTSTPHSSETESSCKLFKSQLSLFRSTVDSVTTLFANQLSIEMGASIPQPILYGADHHDYEDIAEVVAGGVHLEHFHSYQKEKGDRTTSATEEIVNDGGKTIEFHTDQGFFIAFTPGLIVSPTIEQELKLSDGFYIQDRNGERVQMEFTGVDDLVFMMGDGVNQFINNKLAGGHDKLRATPHALTLTVHEDEARVWYGRMVLAPDNAIVPTLKEFTTFGDVRQSLMGPISNGVGIGCSSPNMKAVITTTSRGLEGETEECATDELFCWFRCMALADYDIDLDYCTERNLQVQCMNPRGEVLEAGMGHGDFFPECTDRTHVTHPVTDFPMIEQQDAAVCTSDKWEEFIGADGYDHMVDLTNPNGTETYLLWSIVEDDAGVRKLKARLAFDNVFGWLSLGFANQTDTELNGMKGANIIMAIPGGDYSADAGLDLAVDGSIATYKIDPEMSAFRFWMTPINFGLFGGVSDFEDTGCFTAITFESDHINGVKFNLDGTDEMIWGGNSNDIWMQYHGHAHRSRFTVDWNTGKMAFFGMPMEDVTATDEDVAATEEDVAATEDVTSTDAEMEVKENVGSLNNCFVGIITLTLASIVISM